MVQTLHRFQNPGRDATHPVGRVPNFLSFGMPLTNSDDGISAANTTHTQRIYIYIRVSHTKQPLCGVLSVCARR